MTNSIHTFKLYRNDPLLRLLKDTLRLNWRRAVPAYFAWWILDSVFYAYIAGLFESQHGMIGFIEHLPAYTVKMLWTFGVVFVYYVWGGQAFSSVIWGLYRNGSLRETSKSDSHGFKRDYLWVIDAVEQLWNRKFLVMIPAVVSVIWWVLVFLTELKWKSSVIQTCSGECSLV